MMQCSYTLTKAAALPKQITMKAHQLHVSRTYRGTTLQRMHTHMCTLKTNKSPSSLVGWSTYVKVKTAS